MFVATIISVGKLKEQYWQEAAQEYIKRLRPYVRLRIQEIPEERVTSQADRKHILSREGAKIKHLIPAGSFVVALDSAGVGVTSVELAKKLEEWSQFGRQLVFVIGGPLGLDPDILAQASVSLSLSKMTFTHQMSRILLLEQLYRGVAISHGISYHY